jgi:hypothetical protein
MARTLPRNSLPQTARKRTIHPAVTAAVRPEALRPGRTGWAETLVAMGECTVY